LVPHDASLHPLKTDPESGVAVNVTVSPPWTIDWQAVPQSMPVGSLVTVPVPLPALETATA
jgi:hypothetical protein